MKKIFNSFILLGIGVLFFACSAEDDLIEEWQADSQDPGVVDPTGDAGSLNLTKYVSVGNSLTAGIQDGALFPAGQASSYPSILAGQFAIAGGGEFNNPNIISGASGTGRITLDLAAALAAIAGQGSLADALVAGEANPLTPNSVSVNNFGVPGARAIDVVTPGYGAANPFFGAFQSSAAASVIGDAAAAGGTFFSLWIGSNDVLGYASNGGTNDVYNPLDPSTITSVADFSAAIGGALDALSAGGANGVVLTIPLVTVSPYFQAATLLGGGVELVPLTDQGLVDQLNGAFNVPLDVLLTGGTPGYNPLLDAAAAVGAITQAEADRRKVTYQLGANAPLITDESLTPLINTDISAALGLPGGTVVIPAIPQYRQASGANPLLGLGDLFPLPALFTLGVPQDPDGLIVPGVTVPLEDQFTLTETEQVNIITAVGTFNAIIRGQAAARPNVSLVDLDPLVADLNGLTALEATGIGMSADGIGAADGVFGTVFNGINYVPISFATEELYNSVFSTDFIHLNARGYAFIANEIISVLNNDYGASIPAVNPSDYAPINAPL